MGLKYTAIDYGIILSSRAPQFQHDLGCAKRTGFTVGIALAIIISIVSLHAGGCQKALVSNQFADLSL